MISYESTIIRVNTLINSPYRTVTKIIWLVFIVFCIHFHNNIIASRWYNRRIRSYLPKLPTFLILYFVWYILIFLIIFIVIAMRSSVVNSLWLLLTYLIRYRVIVDTFINSIQIDFVSIITCTVFLLRVKCLREIVGHKIIHHTKLLTCLISLACKLLIWFLTNRSICGKTAVSIRITCIWHRWFSNIIHLAIRHVVH